MGVALDRLTRQRLGERSAGFVLHSLGHRDDAAAQARINGIDLVEELDNRERLFRRVDQIRSIVRRLLPAYGGRCGGWVGLRSGRGGPGGRGAGSRTLPAVRPRTP